MDDTDRHFWELSWTKTVSRTYGGDAVLADRFKLVWEDYFVRMELSQPGRRLEPFIRGYGEVENPKPALFELCNPLPEKPIFGPALMNPREVLEGTYPMYPIAWGLVPTEGTTLYNIGVGSDRPRSSFYLASRGDSRHAFQQWFPDAPSLVREISLAEIPTEFAARLEEIIRYEKSKGKRSEI